MHIPALFCTNDVVFAHSVVRKRMWHVGMAEGQIHSHERGREGDRVPVSPSYDIMMGSRTSSLYEKGLWSLAQTGCVFVPNNHRL